MPILRSHLAKRRRSGRRASQRHIFQTLEQRLALSAVSWNGPGGGAWDVGGKRQASLDLAAALPSLAAQPGTVEGALRAGDQGQGQRPPAENLVDSRRIPWKFLARRNVLLMAGEKQNAGLHFRVNRELAHGSLPNRWQLWKPAISHLTCQSASAMTSARNVTVLGGSATDLSQNHPDELFLG